VDGVVSSTESGLLGVAAEWGDSKVGRRVVQVTSESFSIPLEQLHESDTTKHRFASWTFEQYAAAIQSAKFFTQVQRCLGYPLVDGETLDDKMRNKYFLAGGCARWMFGMTIGEATEDIEGHFDRVAIKTDLISCLQGAKAAGSINHLLQRTKSGPFLVSEFVTRLLAQTCEKAFVVAATAQARHLGNPSFDGWVLEMDFMLQLRLAAQHNTSVKVNVMDTAEETWEVPCLVKFDDPDDLVGDLIGQGVETYNNKLNVNDNAWLVPKRWYQGGYDAAQVLPNSIRFVQVTRGQTHSLKLQYLRALIGALVQIGRKVETVDVVFVVPESQCSTFMLGPVTSHLREWEWTQDKRRVAGFARSHT
jgi:hypothetical protein